MSLSYRRYEDRDLKQILGLWENHSGWGAITPKQFHDWHLATPYGPCMMVVAEDDQEGVVGQMVFAPSKICVSGAIVKSYRTMAPVVQSSFRGADIKSYDHPAYGMFRFGLEEAKRDGCEIIYFLPSIGWINIVKAFPRFGLPEGSTRIYDCVSIPLAQGDAPAAGLPDDYYVRAGRFNDEYDALWNDATSSIPISCGVAKYADWLRWKRDRSLLFELRYKSDHQLRGYIVIKKESSLVKDLLARSVDEMQLVLRSTVQFLRQDSTYASLSELKMMKTPTVIDILGAISHEKVSFRFAFVWFSLIGQNAGEKEWFIMPDD